MSISLENDQKHVNSTPRPDMNLNNPRSGAGSLGVTVGVPRIEAYRLVPPEMAILVGSYVACVPILETVENMLSLKRKMCIDIGAGA